MGHNRTVHISTDISPALHHRFEANLMRPYIKGKSVLDIGCWTGQFLSLTKEARVVTGIDIAKDAIEVAKKTRRGTYLLGSALTLPFRNSQFDVITLWDVIEHLPKNTEDIAISEAVRVLKKGGIFAMSTVTTHPFSILLDPAFFLLGHRHYSESFLRKLLTKHNFQNIRVVYVGGIWSLISHNIMLFKKYVFRSTKEKIPLKNLVEKEYTTVGFDQIHLIAQK